MTDKFLPCKLPCTRYGQKWSILCHDQEVRSRMEYILGTDLRLLQNVDIRDPRHNTNHYMVLSCLRGMTLRENQCYLGSHT